jgi:hypothetical protein
MNRTLIGCSWFLAADWLEVITQTLFSLEEFPSWYLWSEKSSSVVMDYRVWIQSLKKLGLNMESLGKGSCIQQIEVKYFKKSSLG